MSQRSVVWDLPVRLFHWLLVAAITFAVVAGKIGGDWIVWHGRAGLFIVGLVSFRVVWGFVGSPTARFASFVRGPAAIRAYLRGEWQGIGHNPLGALSVLALLVLLATQAGTGLFANDDIAFQGPLADLVGKDTSNALSGVHHLLAKALYALVAVHLLAIAFYIRVKRENLLKPMLTGWKNGDADQHPVPAPYSRIRGSAAFVAAALIAVATVYMTTGGLLPPAPQPSAAVPAAAPGW